MGWSECYVGPDLLAYYITRITKTFSIKMKGDVGMSKPKKHANKVGELT